MLTPQTLCCLCLCDGKKTVSRVLPVWYRVTRNDCSGYFTKTGYLSPDNNRGSLTENSVKEDSCSYASQKIPVHSDRFHGGRQAPVDRQQPCLLLQRNADITVVQLFLCGIYNVRSSHFLYHGDQMSRNNFSAKVISIECIPTLASLSNAKMVHNMRQWRSIKVQGGHSLCESCTVAFTAFISWELDANRYQPYSALLNHATIAIDSMTKYMSVDYRDISEFVRKMSWASLN